MNAVVVAVIAVVAVVAVAVVVVATAVSGKPQQSDTDRLQNILALLTSKILCER